MSTRARRGRSTASFMAIPATIVASVSATIIFAAMTAPTDNQANWFGSRQREFVKWQALHRLPQGVITDLSALVEIWHASAAPKMLVIPPGEHTMGSPISEYGRNSNENQHRVTIDYALAVGKYDVTRSEYSVFVNSTGFMSKDEEGCFVYAGKEWRKSQSADWQHAGFDQSSNDPVVCVSWNEARAYAAWLSQQTGHRYQLLSESEFEYAARAGMTTAYWWGDDVGKANANCGDCGSPWDNRRTSPAASFRATLLEFTT